MLLLKFHFYWNQNDFVKELSQKCSFSKLFTIINRHYSFQTVRIVILCNAFKCSIPYSLLYSESPILWSKVKKQNLNSVPTWIFLQYIKTPFHKYVKEIKIPYRNSQYCCLFLRHCSSIYLLSYSFIEFLHYNENREQPRPR